MSAPAEPATHRDARAVLEAHGYEVEKVWDVCSTDVLFVTKAGVAKTAWLTVTPANTNTGQTLLVEVEDGFLDLPVKPVAAARKAPSGPFPLDRNHQI